MLDSIINWCSHNITYTNIRNIAELFYFIVLTGAMVYYAAKSYKKVLKQNLKLFRIFILIIKIGLKGDKVAIHCI